MRTRDVTIPLALWICAAVCAHSLFGAGGFVVAKVQDDRSELWKLSRQASSLARQSEQTFEVSLGEPSEEPKEEAPPPPKPQDEAKPPQPPIEKPPEEKTPPKPEERKTKDEARVVVVKKDEEKKPLVLPEDPLKDKRIAVRQHARPNQEDNPTAKFIGDEANHVDKETQATQTSHDRDDEQPTPGGNHPSSNEQPGDSEKTRIAESEEHKGERNRAPGEKGTDFDVVHEPKIPKAGAQPTAASPPLPDPRGAPRAPSNDPKPPSSQTAQPQPEAQPAPGGATPPSPDAVNRCDRSISATIAPSTITSPDRKSMREASVTRGTGCTAGAQEELSAAASRERPPLRREGVFLCLA